MPCFAAVGLLAVLAISGPLSAVAVNTPANCETLVEVLRSSPNTTLFYRALNSTGVLATLQAADNTPYTVFAPQDDSFGGLLKQYGVNLTTFEMSKEVAGALPFFINYHIVSGKFLSSQLTDNQQLTTLLKPSYGTENDICQSYDIDGTLVVDVANNNLFIIDDKETTEPSQVVLSNQQSCSSVVHVVNKVLNPCLPMKSQNSAERFAPQGIVAMTLAAAAAVVLLAV